MTAATPRIVGNYTLGELLGRGGTSEVYAAKHRFLGESVAVKILRSELASETAIVDAFVAEAGRTREIDHPNVVRVLDFGRDEASASCYLVMDRITGESLSAHLAARGRIDEAELRPLGAAIADGLAAAHARGIVHRDLKPGNVMMRGDVPTIVDFGIAKSLGEGSAVVTSRRVGTLAYMAPEQLASGLITPSVDIWALGVVMFELATGRLPFEEFTDGRLPQLVDTPLRASDLAPVSPSLASLIARCLERDPGRRPASMTEVARLLREPAAGGEERITADVGAIPAAARWASATPPAAAHVAPRPHDEFPTTRDLMPTRAKRLPMGFIASVLGLLAVIVGGAIVIAKLASSDAAPVAKVPAAMPEPTPVETPRADEASNTAAVEPPTEEPAPPPVEEAAVANRPIEAESRVKKSKRSTKKYRPRSKKQTPSEPATISGEGLK
ncbi:MAG: serine/threonine protein kinase [Kofleriaceae bacterium]|nr:serine/threonine protein kinase [Kofleriaceae bacterium]